MGVLDKFKELRETITGKQEIDKEKKQEEIKTVAKEIEGEYKEAVQEQGKRQALKTVAEIINERVTDPNERRIIDETLKDVLNELKENTAVPVNEIAEDLVVIATEKEEHPETLVEATAEVASDKKLGEIIFENEDIPLEHKTILAEGISDEKVKKEALEKIKTEEENKKIEEDLEQLQKIYKECENFPDGELVAKVNNLNADRTNDKINTLINQILAKKIVDNYTRFNSVMWYQMTNIKPIEDIYAEYLDDSIEDEFLKRENTNNKKENKKKEQNRKENLKKDASKKENKEGKNNQFERKQKAQDLKLRAKKEIEEYLASNIISSYLKTGLWNIPGSKRMRQQSVKEQNEFIKEIEKEYGQPLTKTQIKIIISKMAGKEIDDIKIKQFESKIIDLPRQKRDQICNFGMQLAEQDNRLYNTVIESESLLKKLASMPKEYRDTCIAIMTQALDKELSQFLKKSEEKDTDKKEAKVDEERQ